VEPDAVRTLYDEATASTYNERWHGEMWGNDTNLLAEAIGRRLYEGVRWLDVGCGTGHFLSRFPGVERAGTDLSPSMLGHAQEANPDALFFREGDFRDDVPEWHDQWTLVTCTGEPWSYVATVGEIEQVVENMARWTAPDGTCLLAVQDVTDLTGVRLPYIVTTEPGQPGELWVKGVVWGMVDRSDPANHRFHDDMIWPSLEHWVATFGRFFRTVVVETLPHDPPWLNTPRRVLLATDKRKPGDDQPVHVEFTPPMTLEGGTAPSEQAPPDVDAPPFEPAPVPEADAHPSAPPQPAVGNGSDGAAGRLRDLSLADLAERVRPLDPGFWRTAARRTGSSLRSRLRTWAGS